ncbi:MAG: adenosylcobinamide-GDP ribazoletransferase [Marinibacterium sp.]
MRFLAPIRHFAVATTLLTRLPAPRLPDAAFDRPARSVWAWPLIGVEIGALAGLAGLAALALGLPPALAAGLVVAVEVVLTGAMHEDGLADTADGFWGGQDRARRLEILRDSRIGTYGVLALTIGIGVRWQALAILLPEAGLAPIVAVAAMSRGLMAALMAALPPARDDGLARSVGRPEPDRAGYALAVAAAVTLGLTSWMGLAAAFAAALAVIGLGILSRARIGGLTGDVLGAAQQLATLVMLLVLTATLPG